MYKNRAEREAFLRGYKDWDLFHKFYLGYRDVRIHQFSFKNNAHVYATECGNVVRYNLLIPESDNYNPFDQHSGRAPKEFQAYNLTGCSIGTIVDYMTKRKDVI